MKRRIKLEEERIRKRVKRPISASKYCNTLLKQYEIDVVQNKGRRKYMVRGGKDIEGWNEWRQKRDVYLIEKTFRDIDKKLEGACKFGKKWIGIVKHYDQPINAFYECNLLKKEKEKNHPELDEFEFKNTALLCKI